MEQELLDFFKTCLSFFKKDVFLQDHIFYRHVPLIYKQSIAEHFNNSDWLHYMLLDDEPARNSFANIMSPADIISPNFPQDEKNGDSYEDVPVFLGPEKAVSIPTEIETESSHSESESASDTSDSDFYIQSYDELIEFRHVTNTILKILLFTYIGLVFSYLVFV